MATRTPTEPGLAHGRAARLAKALQTTLENAVLQARRMPTIYGGRLLEQEGPRTARSKAQSHDYVRVGELREAVQ